MQICQIRKLLEKVAQLRDSQSSPKNISFFNDARVKLKTVYETEPTKYLKIRMNDITAASSNKRSAKAWKTVNRISGRKRGSRKKLKASNQEERIKLWLKIFLDLLSKPLLIFDKDLLSTMKST